MRVVRKQSLTGTTTSLVFTKSEWATLTKASTVAASAREKCKEVIGENWEHDSLDTLLAELEYNHLDFADGIILDETFEFPFENFISRDGTNAILPREGTDECSPNSH